MCDGTVIRVGNPSTRKYLNCLDPLGHFLKLLALATGTPDNIEHGGRIADIKGIVSQLVCLVA